MSETAGEKTFAPTEKRLRDAAREDLSLGRLLEGHANAVHLVRCHGDDPARAAIVDLLNEELGTETLAEADSYLEYPLRLAAHGIMSAPQYQLA